MHSFFFIKVIKIDEYITEAQTMSIFLFNRNCKQCKKWERWLLRVNCVMRNVDILLPTYLIWLWYIFEIKRFKKYPSDYSRLLSKSHKAVCFGCYTCFVLHGEQSFFNKNGVRRENDNVMLHCICVSAVSAVYECVARTLNKKDRKRRKIEEGAYEYIDVRLLPEGWIQNGGTANVEWQLFQLSQLCPGFVPLFGCQFLFRCQVT